MIRTALVRRGIATAIALIVASLIGSTLSAAPAAADPEGGTAELRTKLENAARGYNNAKSRLDVSKRKQVTLTRRVKTLEASVAKLTDHVSAMAAADYRGNRHSVIAVLLNSGSPTALLQAATIANYLERRDGKAVRQLRHDKTELDRQQTALQAEIKKQSDQFKVMAKQKKQAEDALIAVGGWLTDGYAASGPSASPAPRNPDGSWPSESCSVDDPTTSGCLTPRTLHAYQQARVAGFTHYTACFRSGGSGEHPQGRACDFAAAPDGFGDEATGADKAYGDRLAGWFIANADRLAVLYVIWFKQIWMPGVGWAAYQGDGTPAGDHRNHVHLSVQ